MKPLKPFKPVTLQRNRFTWRVWWTIAVLACLFVLGLMLSLLVDGALDLAGHAVVSIWQPTNEASAPAPALAPSAQPTVAPLPVWLSIVGAVFLFGLIWGTSLVLDDDDHSFLAVTRPRSGAPSFAPPWVRASWSCCAGARLAFLSCAGPRWAPWWAACWAFWANPGQSTFE